MVHFTRACKTLLSENNKTRLTFEKQQEKNKNIICRPWSVRIEKNCALGLEHGPRPAASGRTQDLWHSFSQYGPPGRQIIYIYFFRSIFPVRNPESLNLIGCWRAFRRSSFFLSGPVLSWTIEWKLKNNIPRLNSRIFLFTAQRCDFFGKSQFLCVL